MTADAPTWGEMEKFLQADRWTRLPPSSRGGSGQRHIFFEKLLDSGELLQTHISHSRRGGPSPGRFGVILREQLEVSRSRVLGGAVLRQARRAARAHRNRAARRARGVGDRGPHRRAAHDRGADRRARRRGGRATDSGALVPAHGLISGWSEPRILRHTGRWQAPRRRQARRRGCSRGRSLSWPAHPLRRGAGGVAQLLQGRGPAADVGDLVEEPVAPLRLVVQLVLASGIGLHLDRYLTDRCPLICT